MEFRRAVRSPQALSYWRKSWVDHIRNTKVRPAVQRGYADARLFFCDDEVLSLIEATRASVGELGVGDVMDLLPTRSGFMLVNPDQDTYLDGQSRVPLGVFWCLEESGMLHMNMFAPVDLFLNENANVIPRNDRKGLKREMGDTLYPYKMEHPVHISEVPDILREGAHLPDPSVYTFWISFLALLSSKKLLSRSLEEVTLQPGQKASRPFRDVVSVIKVGQIRHVTADSHEGSRLSCRFIVSGHFRNQPYKGGVTKKIFIDPYIKGPAGAPMKVNRPVYKL